MNRYPFNRLWVQFAVAFAAVILIAAIVIFTTGFLLRPERPNDIPRSFDEAPPELREQAAEFVATAFIVLAATGSVVGIAGGVWMARRLTAPLEELTKGAEAIGARDLAYRVAERGSYETISLAHTFNQMAADLQEAEQLRRHLLTDVAHELRTPLTVLQGNLRAILDDVYELDKGEIARLYDQTRHLSTLVNDLHELAQAEARQLPLDMTALDLIDLTQTAVELLEPLAAEQGVTLVTQMPPERCCVRVDRARMMQVLQNLLTNALRHTPAGGTISVRVAADAKHATVTVGDTGDGIAAEHLPLVFDRFYRTDGARDRDAGGAGLGLAIVRALVELQNGSVTVDSAGIGAGATFRVTLPALGGEAAVQQG